MTHQDVEKCPKCSVGMLKKRKGKFGDFWGCSKYPNCHYTANCDDRCAEQKSTGFIAQVDESSWEPWVNASSVGEAQFCPQSFYLRSSDEEPNSQAKFQMKRGDLKHASVSQDRRCYIATYAFGDDHIITNNLRDWRDSVLLHTWYGSLLAECYYKLSPCLIKVFGKSRLFNRMARRIIKAFAKWIGAVR